MKVRFLKNYNFYLPEIPAKRYSVAPGDIMDIEDEDKIQRWISQGIVEPIKAIVMENKMFADIFMETKKATKKATKKK